jgi:hypothetical protein
VTNYYSNTVSIHGLGGFSGSTNVSVGTNPWSVAIGDFNGDGKQDFAATNVSSNNVSIRLGDGMGGFSGSTNVVVGTNPHQVAIGDFNGDGKQDFATANAGSSTVSIRMGDGMGGFSGSTNVSVGSGAEAVAIGDFNGDGKQDFAAVNVSSNNVSIRLGDGLGGFSGSTNVAVGVSPRGINIGDFNGDGKQDFATANLNSASVSIRLGDGLGGFSGSTNVSVGSDPYSLAIGDFNGDGRQDFATANYNSNSVSIFLGVAGNINDINIKGNGVSITDGDITPSLTDNTDFGITCSSGTTISKTFVLENVGTAALQLNSGAITFTGDNATQFAVSGISLPLSIEGGTSTTFTVTFTPDVTTGIKNAILHISSNDCDEADYDFAVQATQNANITYYTDSDGDGYGTGTGTSLCVNPGTGYASEAGDCNDADAAVNPAATEVCNNMTDDNCDGNTDEGCATYTYYADTDNDGYGNPASSVTSGSATPPTGYIVDNTDCNDINSAINPGATEICNSGVDDDCDGFADNADEGVTGQNTYYADTDGDGFGTGSVILSCTQPANTSTNDDDCNDGETMVNPGATELCNSVDDDCDGTLNEGFPTTTYYRDYDGDGKGNPAVSIASCYQPAGYVTNANDCDDNSATACPKPSGMSSSDITDVSATVSWGNLICATKYRLEYRRKTPPISAWTVVYSTSPTYTINGLSGPNIQYQWRVATICSPNGTSAESGYATLQSFYTKYIVYTDADMDGFGDVNVTPSYVSTMPQAGYSYNQTDCDDAVSTTRPGAPELCNGIDDDCDLIVDEGANWYQDADGDGLGNAVVSQNSCLQPVGYVSNSADCNDNSTTAACATPTNMTATNIGISFATINWTTSSCASSYTVMYRISPAGTFSTQFNTTGSSMMLSGLLPGTTYQARVRAKCPPPNTVSTSNWVYVTFTTNGAGLIEQVEEEIYTLEATGFSVYPNPGDGRFTLSIMIETDGELDIYVLDGFGKQVKSIHWSVYEGVTINEIDLTNLPDGVYHINIRRGEVVQTKKVVILK